jgi:subtilisin-like proprotein convertase family protein
MRLFYPLAALLLSSSLLGQTYNGAGGLISDDNVPNDFPLTVSGLNPPILNQSFGLKSVCINMTHTYDADMEVRIIAPDGTDIQLFDGVGGGGDDFTNTCLDPGASTSILSGNPPFTGSFSPIGYMGNINNGQNGNGTWILRCIDHWGQDQGNLLSWSLNFGPNPATPFAFSSSNLPIIVINTNSQNIPDEPKILVDMGIIYNGVGIRNYLTDPFNHYNGKINIELRGSSSQMFPKKTYGFETADVFGNSIDTGLIGMPKESDWILSANYSDKSFQNNVLAYKLARDMGHYATRTRYVELVLNGQYMGVYVLMEKIKRDNKRVKISKLSSDEIAGDSLTGGYIIKIDKFTGNGNQYWASPYPPAVNSNGQQIFFQYEYPDEDSIVLPQKLFIQQYVDSFEDALAGPNFTNPLTGYRKYCDEYSFADYFILNELSKNVDGYRISTFLHKNKYSKGGKLIMGPVWDYDIAWGNANYCQGGTTTGWAYEFGNVCAGDGFQIPFWWQRMLQDTTFQNAVRCQWSLWRSDILDTTNLFGYIDSIALYLNEGQARNFIQWPILGQYVWPNPAPQPNTFQGETDELKTWLRSRIAWLDANIPGTCYSVGQPEYDYENSSFYIYPNPARDNLNIEFFIADSKKIFIEIIDVTGRIVSADAHEFSSGENRMNLQLLPSLPAGVYMLRISGDGISTTKRFIKN